MSIDDALVRRVAEAMYVRVMVETRDEWPLFECLPEQARLNWLRDAREAIGTDVTRAPAVDREPVTNLRLPQGTRRDEQGRNVASETRDVPVIIDPDLDTLGLHTQGYGGSAIYLREYDEQVLLHEALHVMLDPIIPYEGEGCLNHKVICAIEVGLTDAGWSLIDAATVAAQARAKAGEDIAAAIEAKAHDCSCDRGCCYLCCNSCRGGQHTNSGPWWEYEGAPVAARIARDLTRADTGEA